MSCSKKYGPGAVYVVRESTPGSVVAVAGTQYLQCQAATIGGLNREKLENSALRQDRGQNLQYDGSQSEISWELTVLVPQGPLSSASLPAALQALLWGLGKADGAGTLTAGSICGRTLQIVRGDRDGSLLEVLNGCIVQQAVWNYSCTEMPTIVFSGVAAKKIEVIAGKALGDQTLDISSGATTVDVGMFGSNMLRSSDLLMGAASTCTLPTGINVTIDGTALTVSALVWTDNALTMTFTATTSAISDATMMTFVLPSAASGTTYSAVSTSGWEMGDWDDASEDYYPWPAKTFTFTVESGLSYGELVAGTVVPSEILSGTTKVTGSVSMYLDNEALNGVGARAGQSLYVKHGTTSTAGKVLFGPDTLTEHPSYELSVDDAASGDFAYTFTPTSTSSFDVVTFSAANA